MNEYLQKMPRMLFFSHPPFWDDMKPFLEKRESQQTYFDTGILAGPGLDPRECDLLALLYF